MSLGRQSTILAWCVLAIFFSPAFAWADPGPLSAGAEGTCAGAFELELPSETAHLKNAKKSKREKSAKPVLPLAAPALSDSMSMRSPGQIYFVLTRKFGKGTLDAIREMIPHFKEVGVDTIMISPVHEQSTQEMTGTRNDHGYWWSDPYSVAKDLGGEKAFAELQAFARQHGIEICLDMVVDHAGYAKSVTMRYPNAAAKMGWVEKVIDTSDPQFFRTQQVPIEILDAPESAQTREEALQRLSEISCYGWCELPVFNHKHPEILPWLLAAYTGFLDRGVPMFRADAFKHVPLEFWAAFLNEFNKHAQKSGKDRPVVIAELLSYNYVVLDAVNHYLSEHASGTRMMFLDFPAEFHWFENAPPNHEKYQFHHFRGFIEWRERFGDLLERLIPILEDHDFRSPMNHHFLAILSYMTADFFSLHPSILYHGGEAIGAKSHSRDQVDVVQSQTPLAQIKRDLNEALKEPRQDPGFKKSIFHVAHGNLLVVEKRLQSESWWIVINKGDSPLEGSAELANAKEDLDFESVSGTGDLPSIAHDATGSSPRVVFRVPPRSIWILKSPPKQAN